MQRVIYTKFVVRNNIREMDGMGGSVPRQLYLLLLLDGDPVKQRLRLQKLMFLLQKEIVERKGLQASTEEYDFTAYNYGPFSDELIDDIEFLKDLELIDVIKENDVELYKITEKGRKFLADFLQKAPSSSKKLLQTVKREIENLKKKWNKEPLKKLLRYVYEYYPEYTEKSLIRHLLSG